MKYIILILILLIFCHTTYSSADCETFHGVENSSVSQASPYINISKTSLNMCFEYCVNDNSCQTISWNKEVCSLFFKRVEKLKFDVPFNSVYFLSRNPTLCDEKIPFSSSQSCDKWFEWLPSKKNLSSSSQDLSLIPNKLFKDIVACSDNAKWLKSEYFVFDFDNSLGVHCFLEKKNISREKYQFSKNSFFYKMNELHNCFSYKSSEYFPSFSSTTPSLVTRSAKSSSNIQSKITSSFDQKRQTTSVTVKTANTKKFNSSNYPNSPNSKTTKSKVRITFARMTWESSTIKTTTNNNTNNNTEKERNEHPNTDFPSQGRPGKILEDQKQRYKSTHFLVLEPAYIVLIGLGFGSIALTFISIVALCQNKIKPCCHH